MKQVKLLYHHPNKGNRTPGSAKILSYKDHEGKEHFCEPEMLGKKIIYTLPEEYARRLLAGQPDRYFLLEPKSMMVRFKSADGLSSHTREVKSIMGGPRMKELEELLAKEAEAAPAGVSIQATATGAVEGGKTIATATGMEGIHVPPDNPTAPPTGNPPPPSGKL